ncbi:MAG: SDR family NAD(P)-dependent oxidoreductase [Eubacteriales bacterium]|nr:SDR family NAD(P)-dependent oxidoreductase [Eubacteriales bacterium]
MQNTLITGATGGLGQALVRAYAPQSELLLVHGRDTAQLNKLCLEFKKEFPHCKFIPLSADFCRLDSAKDLVEQLQNININCEKLILNVGYSESRSFAEISPEASRDLLFANLNSQIELASRLLPQLEKIIVISSSGAYQPGPYTALYYAAKSALSSWAAAICEEGDLEVLLVCPGALKTNFALKAGRQIAPLALSPTRVAADILRADLRARKYLAPGLFNKLAISLTKLMPASINAKIVGKIQKTQTK